MHAGYLFTLGLSVLCLSVLGLALASTARAELPPDAYRSMQQSAPEAVVLRVQAVETSICWFWLCDGRDVTLKAEVGEVTRSASGLKPGQHIEIRYRHVPLDGRSGPRPIRVVAEGETTPAFLEQTAAGHFRPAARGASFQGLVERY